MISFGIILNLITCGLIIVWAIIQYKVNSTQSKLNHIQDRRHEFQDEVNLRTQKIEEGFIKVSEIMDEKISRLEEILGE